MQLSVRYYYNVTLYNIIISLDFKNGFHWNSCLSRSDNFSRVKKLNMCGRAGGDFIFRHKYSIRNRKYGMAYLLPIFYSLKCSSSRVRQHSENSTNILFLYNFVCTRLYNIIFRLYLIALFILRYIEHSACSLQLSSIRYLCDAYISLFKWFVFHFPRIPSNDMSNLIQVLPLVGAHYSIYHNVLKVVSLPDWIICIATVAGFMPRFCLKPFRLYLMIVL